MGWDERKKSTTNVQALPLVKSQLLCICMNTNMDVDKLILAEVVGKVVDRRNKYYI